MSNVAPSPQTTWEPKRSLAECHRIMTQTPTSPLATETVLSEGRVVRFYKHAPPSLRQLFLHAVKTHGDKDYLVFDNERYTYNEAFAHASRAASIFREVYNVHKGDRVAIVSRNYPQFVFAYWATYLLGAVPVLINAWVPTKVISHCITSTTCKLIIVDCERAKRLAPFLHSISNESGATGVLVFTKTRDSEADRRAWAKYARDWEKVMNEKKYSSIAESKVWEKEPECKLGDDGSIFFTSGTTGLPKGVLGSQMASLAAVFQNLNAAIRAALREGQDLTTFLTPKPGELQKSALIAIPLFHTSGTQSGVLGSTIIGAKLVFMWRWDVDEAIRLIDQEKITAAGGVPALAMDLLESHKFKSRPTTIDTMSYGGAPAPPNIAQNVSKLGGGTMANQQGYGLTETSAGCVNVCGQDSHARPLSTGLPVVTADVLVMDPKTNKSLPPGQIGEIWIHGPQVMKGYWNNPEATKKVLTADGWFNSQDLGYLDEEGFLYVKGRVKDIIIRGGENIDAVTIENALYEHPGVMGAAAVAVPSARLGELPAAFAVPKEGASFTEAELLSFVKERLPAFAVPVMIVVQKEPLEMNPAGKIVKEPLRAKARQLWARRATHGARQSKL